MAAQLTFTFYILLFQQRNDVYQAHAFPKAQLNLVCLFVFAGPAASPSATRSTTMGSVIPSSVTSTAQPVSSVTNLPGSTGEDFRGAKM